MATAAERLSRTPDTYGAKPKRRAVNGNITLGPVDGVAAWLGYINLTLLVFNLLPALPLDGGRVLRAALWRARGDLGWATRIATNSVRAFGYLFMGRGIAVFI